MKQILPAFAAILFLIACNNSSKENKASTSVQIDSGSMAAKPAESNIVYTPAMVANKKDFSCGMPVTAGISDTVHYKGKAYGFCSKECKDDFLKTPEKYLAENK